MRTIQTTSSPSSSMYPPPATFLCEKPISLCVCVVSKKELLSRIKERSNWKTKERKTFIIIIIIIFRVTNGLGFWRETRERRERRALFRRRRRGGEINNNVGARGNVERGPRDRRVRERKPESLAELSQTLRAEVLQRLQILLRAARFRGAKRGSDEYGARRGVDILHVPLRRRGGEGRRRGKPKKVFRGRNRKDFGEGPRRAVRVETRPDWNGVLREFWKRRYQPIAVFNHDERFRPRFRWETYHFWTRRGRFRRVATHKRSVLRREWTTVAKYSD